MTAATRLPAGYEALEPFVDLWSAPDMLGRMRQRIERSPAEVQAFYEAAKYLAEPALRYLDTLDLQKLDAAQTTLLNVILSLAHASQAIERLKGDEQRHATVRQAIQVTRTDADWPVPA